MSVLACKEVRKSYKLGERAVEALRGVSMEIAEPGFYAIMGQSGSGKSTLLHLLAALDRPDAGTIQVASTRTDEMSDREATLFRRTKIGIVFQQFNLIPTLTAEENVELPGLLAAEDPKVLRARSRDLLARLGLSDRATHRPDALSGGEQQRVAIARALLFEPKLLLADEPSGNLDSASSEKLWTLLEDLCADGSVTIVMVTHEPAAAAHCKRVFVVKDGQICGHFDTRENGGKLDAAGVSARYQQCVR